MYQVKIVLKETLTLEGLDKQVNVINAAFETRVGTAINKGEGNVCIFEDADPFGILALGNLTLEENEEFLKNIELWWWEDKENPNESHDIFKAFIEYEKRYN